MRPSSPQLRHLLRVPNMYESDFIKLLLGHIRLYAIGFCPFRLGEDGEPRDRRFVCGEYSFARADGEDWDAPGNPYLERLSRVKSEF